MKKNSRGRHGSYAMKKTYYYTIPVWLYSVWEYYKRNRDEREVGKLSRDYPLYYYTVLYRKWGNRYPEILLQNGRSYIMHSCRVQVLNLSQLEYASTPVVHKKYYDLRVFFIIYYKVSGKDKTQEEFTIGQNVVLLFFL